MLRSIYFTNRITHLYGEFKFYSKEDLKLAIESIGGVVSEQLDDSVHQVIMASGEKRESFKEIERFYPKTILCAECKIDDFLQEFPDTAEFDDGIMHGIIDLAKEAKSNI